MVTLLCAISLAMQKISTTKVGIRIWFGMGILPLVIVLTYAFFGTLLESSMSGFFLVIFIPPTLVWAALAFIGFLHWKRELIEQQSNLTFDLSR